MLAILLLQEVFWGKDLFHDGLSVAYKFTVALISANLYPQKQNVKKEKSNKQEKFDEQ